MVNTVLSDRFKTHSSYPDIAAFHGKLLCVWQESTGRNDIVKLSVIDAGTGVAESTETVSAEGGIAFTPRIAVLGDEAVIVWSEKKGAGWVLRTAAYDGRRVSLAEPTAYSDGVFNPVLLPGKGSYPAWLCWSSVDGKNAAVLGAPYGSPMDLMDPICFSDGVQMAARPEAASGNDGAIWITYDGYDDDGYHVYVQRISGTTKSAPLIVSLPSHWATRPAILALDDSMLVTWYESAPRNENSYWSAILVAAGDTLVKRRITKIDDSNNWNCWTSMCEDSDSGDAYFIFSRGWKRTGLRAYREGVWSSEHEIPSGGDFCIRRARGCCVNGKIAVAWQRSETNGHRHRWSDVGLTLVSEMEELRPVAEMDRGNQFNLPIQVYKELASPSAEKVAAWSEGSLSCYAGTELLCGDIHGQSGLSDGQGEVEEYFAYAKKTARLDFCALTDHDCFPNIISPAEWEYSCTIGNASDRDGYLSTILAYEWTSNEYKTDYGHKNAYFPGSAAWIFRCTEPAGDNPSVLFANLKAKGAFCVPHHPAAVWNVVSAATDWNYHDEKAQRLVEIFSRHAPFEYFGNSSPYTKNVEQAKGKSVVDALKRGYHLGIIAGSDSHQLEHGVEGGILMVYSDGHTRKDIFNALYQRAVYATTGVRIHLEFSVNGKPMGSILRLPQESEAAIAIRCLGTSAIKVVEIVTERGSAVRYTPDSDEMEARCTLPVAKIEPWCYVKVVQYDEHIAWSSPIWIER